MIRFPDRMGRLLAGSVVRSITAPLVVSFHHHEADHDGNEPHIEVPHGPHPSPALELTAALVLIPLALGGGEPGKEIQAPLAAVVLGGLLTSTFLNMVVVPILYLGWGGGESGVWRGGA